MKSFDRPLGYGLRVVIAGLLVFCGSAAIAEKVEDLPKPTGYVSDYAHVLSPQAVARVDQIARELDRSAHAQIAVVTVHTMDGDDSADYATRLFEKIQIGDKKTDRGILLFFAIDDRRRSIKTGFGLEAILNDAKTGDIGRSIVPMLRAQDYDGAVLSEVSQIAQVIADDAHVGLSDETTGATAPHRVHRRSPFGGIILLIILLVLFGGSWIFRLLFGGLLLNSLGGGWRGGGWGGGGWGSGGGWGGGNSGGGGGWGGGDSGGGGGFGGFGGGSTGGGGSDGSW